jgi:LPXTG-motif cell wall-anchored protein
MAIVSRNATGASEEALLALLGITILVIGGLIAIRRWWVRVEALSQLTWFVGLGEAATGIGFIVLSRAPVDRSWRIYGFGFALFGLSFLMIWPNSSARLLVAGLAWWYECGARWAAPINVTPAASIRLLLVRTGC